MYYMLTKNLNQGPKTLKNTKLHSDITKALQKNHIMKSINDCYQPVSLYAVVCLHLAPVTS